MKRFFVLISIGIGLVFALIVHGNAAAVTFANPISATSLEDIISKLQGFLLTVAIALVPIVVVIAGFLFLTAAGDPTKISRARNILLWGAIGVGIVLIGGGLVSVIKEIVGAP